MRYYNQPEQEDLFSLTSVESFPLDQLQPLEYSSPQYNTHAEDDFRTLNSYEESWHQCQLFMIFLSGLLTIQTVKKIAAVSVTPIPTSFPRPRAFTSYVVTKYSSTQLQASRRRREVGNYYHNK
ncbi:hypothetical protein ABKN59_005219 [Abortiporus biennis]